MCTVQSHFLKGIGLSKCHKKGDLEYDGKEWKSQRRLKKGSVNSPSKDNSKGSNNGNIQKFLRQSSQGRLSEVPFGCKIPNQCLPFMCWGFRKWDYVMPKTRGWGFLKKVNPKNVFCKGHISESESEQLLLLQIDSCNSQWTWTMLHLSKQFWQYQCYNMEKTLYPGGLSGDIFSSKPSKIIETCHIIMLQITLKNFQL